MDKGSRRDNYFSSVFGGKRSAGEYRENRIRKVHSNFKGLVATKFKMTLLPAKGLKYFV